MDREHQRARHPRRVRKEGEEFTGVRALFVTNDAERRRCARRVTGKQVAAARAPNCQKSAAGAGAPFHLGRVGDAAGDHQRAAILLIPTEGGHVLVTAEQQPCLASSRLARKIALPADDPVAAVGEPACDRRHIARVDRFAQNLLPEAIDLEEDHSRYIGFVGAPRLAHPSAYDAQVIGVAVDVKQCSSDCADDRHQNRDEEGAEHRGLALIDDVEREPDHRSRRNEREQAERQHRQRQ